MFELLALVGICLTVVGSVCSAIGKVPKIRQSKQEYLEAKERKKIAQKTK